MLVGLLAIALVVVAVWQSAQAIRASGEVAALEEEAVDLNQAYLPPVFGDVDVEGDALVLRGRAEPEAVVSVLDGGRRVRQVQADETGAWSLAVAVEPGTALDLSLESFVEGEPVAGDEALLRVPAPGAESGVAQVPLVVLTAPGGPTRVVQTPFGGPLADGPLSLDAVDYDPRGSVIVAGRSEAAGRVRLMDAERVLGESPVGAGERWLFIAPDVLGERLDIAASLLVADGEVARVAAPLVRLSAGEAVRQEATVWQVRRVLPGGGEQVSAVFATPPEEPEEESEE